MRSIVLISIVAVAGCAGADRVAKVFEAQELQGAPFSSVLVVGLSSDRGLRRYFENTVAATLRTGGTQAQASIETGLDEVSRDGVLAVAQETGAEAVLITWLMSADARPEITAGRVDAQVRRRDELAVDFFRYDYVEYQDPPTLDIMRSVVLATDLYSVAGQARLWGIESTAVDKESVYGVVDSASRAIDSQLRRDGLLR